MWLGRGGVGFWASRSDAVVVATDSVLRALHRVNQLFARYSTARTATRLEAEPTYFLPFSVLRAHSLTRPTEWDLLVCENDESNKWAG